MSEDGGRIKPARNEQGMNLEILHWTWWRF